MPAATDFRPAGHGLHPRHYAALRIEILRTAVGLSDEQLLDLTDAMHCQIRQRRPGRPIRRPDAWVEAEPRAFA